MLPLARWTWLSLGLGLTLSPSAHALNVISGSPSSGSSLPKLASPRLRFPDKPAASNTSSETEVNQDSFTKQCQASIQGMLERSDAEDHQKKKKGLPDNIKNGIRVFALGTAATIGGFEGLRETQKHLAESAHEAKSNPAVKPLMLGALAGAAIGASLSASGMFIGGHLAKNPEDEFEAQLKGSGAATGLSLGAALGYGWAKHGTSIPQLQGQARLLLGLTGGALAGLLAKYALAETTFGGAKYLWNLGKQAALNKLTSSPLLLSQPGWKDVTTSIWRVDYTNGVISVDLRGNEVGAPIHYESDKAPVLKESEFTPVIPTSLDGITVAATLTPIPNSENPILAQYLKRAHSEDPQPLVEIYVTDPKNPKQRMLTSGTIDWLSAHGQDLNFRVERFSIKVPSGKSYRYHPDDVTFLLPQRIAEPQDPNLRNALYGTPLPKPLPNPFRLQNNSPRE